MAVHLFSFFQKRALRVPAVIVLIVALALTAVAAYYAHNFKQSEFDRKLGEVAVRVSSAIDDRLKSYGHVLVDTRSFIAASSVSRHAFQSFVGGINLPVHYPGLMALGYAAVEPRPGADALPRLPLLYLEPFQGDRHEALGFDLNSDPDRRAALEVARDTGMPTMSRRLHALPEDREGRGSGFMIVLPVYSADKSQVSISERRAALRGYVYSIFRGRDLLEQIAREEATHLQDIDLEVFDGVQTDGAHLLFSTLHEEHRAPGVRQVVHKLIDNHEWTVSVVADPAAFASNNRLLPFWIFLIGSFASFVIYFFARAAMKYSTSLEKSESFLSLITNSLPSLIGYVDRQHRYLYNNEAYFAWWGQKPADLRMKHVADVLGPSYETYFKPLLIRAMNGEHVTFEHSHEAPGSACGRRYYRGEYIPDRNSDGFVQGVVVVVNDQTEQKLSQEKLKDERRITELINEVGMSLQAELHADRLAQKITDVATELTGAEAGAFVYQMKADGSDDSMLYTISGPLRDSVSLPAGDPRVIASSFLDEHIVRLDDVTGSIDFDRFCPTFVTPGAHLPMRSYLAAPVVSRSGEIMGGLVFAHTRPGVFSERAEKLIAGIAAQAAVALDNAKLYSEAQAVNRVKDEFLATLSHELRTPMNVILGYSELLKDEALPEEMRSYVDAIYRNAKAQNQLIADLLDISAIITGKLGFQPSRVNSGEVVRAAIENIRFAAESKGVALHETIPMESCPIIGDPTRLQQIVWNLLSNAVKFTPQGGQVGVNVRQESGRCVIEVSDTGIGIDAEFMPYVFERFSQEDSSRSRRFGGLGLGLSIVRQLVELHGGQIRVESEGKNRGARFVVTLPMAGPIELSPRGAEIQT